MPGTEPPAQPLRWYRRIGFVRRAEEVLKHFFITHASPAEIAGGMAFGIFISFTPLIGLHIPLALGASALFRWNKLAALAGTWINNPFTFIPIYYLCWKAGVLVMGQDTSRWQSFEDFKALADTPLRELLASGWQDILVPMTAGGMLIGIPVTLLAYFITREAMVLVQFRRLQRMDHRPATPSTNETPADKDAP